MVQQITAYVPGPISRANVWLAEAPAGMQQCVWDVVSLAALSAMEHARAGLRAATRGHTLAPGEETQEPTAGAAAGTPLEVARARAVLDFWQRAQGFAELGVAGRTWAPTIPSYRWWTGA